MVTILGRKDNPYSGTHKGVYIRFSLDKQVWSVYRDGINIGRESTLEQAFDYANRVDSGQIEPQPVKTIKELKNQIENLETSLAEANRSRVLYKQEIQQFQDVNIEHRKKITELRKKVEELETSAQELTNLAETRRMKLIRIYETFTEQFFD